MGKNGQAALHVAVETQNQEIVELLLKAGASPNVRNQYGRTPIFEAVKRHNASLIERLIQAGADVNVKEKLGGETPFLSSVSNVEGSPKIMRLLAKHGADVFAIDTYDRSALNIASRWLGQKDYHSEKDRLIADGLRRPLWMRASCTRIQPDTRKSPPRVMCPPSASSLKPGCP